MTGCLTLDEVNSLDTADFVNRFGGVYEHSPWAAERAAAARPFASLTALHAALAAAVASVDLDTRLALLRAHPDLAGRAALAGEMTQESRLEQASAGLDTLTRDEMARFTRCNETYRQQFGFPFILAVKHWGKEHILAAFDGRLGNDRDTELARALAEVDKIAFSRLLDLVVPAPTGRLTTHVLDTARGRPAAAVRVELARVYRSGDSVVKQLVTNADGRCDEPLLAAKDMAAGRWRLSFGVGAYFLATGQDLTAPSFLDLVPIRFAIANPEQHYHVPLLVTPWSFSTYRGS